MTAVAIMFFLWSMAYGLRTANAAVPHLINYQGKLTDASGAPLDGSYNITFRIYDAEKKDTGSLLWEETYDNLNIQKGIFSVLLGSVKGLNLAFDIPYFLEIKVGDDEPMHPRQRITSAGYAMMSEKAERVKGAENVFLGSGNIGMGTLSPTAKLEVVGQVKISGGSPGTGKVLTSDASGLAGWEPVVISGSGSSMNLPTGATYTVLCWATYFTCEDTSTTLRLDNTDKKNYNGAGNDSQGCDQNTIMVRLTSVAAGSHNWSLYKSSGGISQEDYLWLGFRE